MVETLSRTVRIRLGIVLERHRGVTPWQAVVWRVADVFPGAPPTDGHWRELCAGEGWARYHAATLDMDLFHTDTAGYHLNLSQRPPRVWVVLRPAGDETAGTPEDERPAPFFVTASAHEAEAYQVSGAETVEPVPMPAELVALVADFVAQHHVDAPFVKRERQPVSDDDGRPRGRRRPGPGEGGI